MPLKLARDLLQDRYSRVLRRTLEVMMVALPVVLWFSITHSINTAQTIGVAVFMAITYGLYLLLYIGREHWVGPLLITLLMVYTTWDIVAYGSVRSAGTMGYLCAVVAAGITMRRGMLAVVIGLCVTLLGLLTWAEIAGIMTRDEYSVSPTFWVSHVTALVGVAIGTATCRQLVQRALNDQQLEVERRAAAEADLQRSEQQLRRVFELSPAGIVVQSVNTREILDINPAFERIFGYSREEYMGTHDHASLWMDTRQRDAMLSELLEKNRLSGREVIGRRRDGSAFNALVSSEISGVGGDRIIISTIADMSVEVEARRSLQRSQELFSKAFDFSPMNMMISRASDGVFLAVNSADSSVQGYKRSELLGRTAVETGAWTDESQRLQFVQRLRREGQVVRFETRMRHKLGHLVDCALWAVIVDIDGEDCVLSCSLNMTEEKRREAVLLDVARGVSGETGESFFRQLTQSLAGALGADMVMVGEIQAASQVQTLALWTDSSVAANIQYALAGTPCDTAMKWDDMCSHLDRVHEIFPDDRALSDGGFRAYMGMALRDPEGRPIGILSALWRAPQQTSADRDALVRIFASRAAAELIRLQHERQILLLNEGLEQRVADRTAELRATNAELESFAYSVSHDLQTPLRGIDGFTALLGQQLEGVLSTEQQRMFGRVRINVARMGDLISDLLGLAKVSKREMRREPVDLSALATQVGEALRQSQHGRDIRITVAPDLRAHCDRNLARIALENLLGNAIKYTRPREAALIEIGPVEGQRGVLYVRDNGVGFDMSYADKLFKPFNRLHHDNEFEGSGVGLATVHRILERHGGGITGCARVNEGATFRFSFERMPVD